MPIQDFFNVTTLSSIHLVSCSTGFLHLRPVRLRSFVLSIFTNSHVVHYLFCKTEKPTEQRTVSACLLSSSNPECLHCRFTSRTIISTRPLAMYRVRPSAPLPVQHRLGSPRLDVISCSVQCRIKIILRKKIFDEPIKRRNGGCCGAFFGRNMSLQSDHTFSLDKSELRACLDFLVMRP